MEREQDLPDDAGTTLLEVVLAMTMLTIFLGIFTSAIIVMTQSTNKVQSVAQSVDAGNNAFMRLDKTVRYATGISNPALSSAGNWTVRMSSVDAAGIDQCTALRVAGGRLEQRTWTPNGDAAPTVFSGWAPLASNVTNGAAAAGSGSEPFVVPAVAAGTSSDFRRLTVRLVTTGGPVSSATSTRTSATFTALNSTAAATEICSPAPAE